MKTRILFLFTFLICLAPVSWSMAETPKAAVQKKEEAQKKPEARKEMTKPEMLEVIGHNLEAEDEILSFIPELKEETDPEGKGYYTYQIGPKAVKLDDLEEEALKKVLNRVTNEAVRIRTEKINRQMQIQAQINTQLLRQSQQRAVATPPPVPISVPTVPTPPPQPPPQSRIPPVPPSPPRR